MDNQFLYNCYYLIILLKRWDVKTLYLLHCKLSYLPNTLSLKKTLAAAKSKLIVLLGTVLPWFSRKLLSTMLSQFISFSFHQHFLNVMFLLTRNNSLLRSINFMRNFEECPILFASSIILSIKTSISSRCCGL